MTFSQVSVHVTFTSWKLGLSFYVKEETTFEHKQDAVYHVKHPEDDCPIDYIGETKKKEKLRQLKSIKVKILLKGFYWIIKYNLETEMYLEKVLQL